MRRALLALAVVGLIGCGVLTGAAPARAVNPAERHVIIGASITRLAGPELLSQIPYIVVDAFDGRSWEIPSSTNGSTLWQAYEAEKPLLRPGHGDWLIVEIGRGLVPVATNQAYLEQLLGDLDASVNVALVTDHVYYGAQTAEMQAWNADTNAMLRGLDPLGHTVRLVEWDQWVTDWTAARLGQGVITPAAAALGQPLVYDGRHPTGAAAHPGQGGWRYAAGVAAAVS